MGAGERAVASVEPERPPGATTADSGAPADVRLAGPLRLEVVTDLDDLIALCDPWEALVHRSPQATAYATPAFVLTWYRHFERPGGVFALTVWHHDTLVGIAPFARTRLGHGPAALTLLVSAGTEHGDYGDPLLGPDPTPVAHTIADHLADLAHHRTVTNLRRLRDDSPILRALETRHDVTTAPMGQIADAAVISFDRMDDPPAHLHRLAKKHNVPRRLRRLTEAHGGIRYRPDTPDPTTALDTMQAMLLERWGPHQGPRLFHGPRMDAFTREAVHALTTSGHARIATLTAGERPVAVNVVFAVDDRYVSDSVAVDHDLASFGPGQAALSMLLEHAQAAGVTEVDLRAGDFPYKYKWANASHRTRSVTVTAPGLQGDVMMVARRGLMSLRARRLGRLVARPA
jgi:CelD/BcsL family acetyltransferase involved in cellulose biosynthesis